MISSNTLVLWVFVFLGFTGLFLIPDININTDKDRCRHYRIGLDIDRDIDRDKDIVFYDVFVYKPSSLNAVI